MNNPPHSREASGFSLIELLTVLAFVALMTTATVPALRGMMDGINVTAAAGVAEAEFSLARQTAMSRSLPVEVRLYKVEGPEGPAWRAIGLVVPGDADKNTPDEWLTAAAILPGKVSFDITDEKFSTIITQAEEKPTSGPLVAPWNNKELTTAPKSVREADYVAFRFQPDGSTNLPSKDGPWVLTMKNITSQKEGERPAANFVSIVLDSLTGRMLTYQP